MTVGLHVVQVGVFLRRTLRFPIFNVYAGHMTQSAAQG